MLFNETYLLSNADNIKDDVIRSVDQSKEKWKSSQSEEGENDNTEFKELIMINRIQIKNRGRKPKEKYKQQQTKLFKAYVEPLKDQDFNIISDQRCQAIYFMKQEGRLQVKEYYTN